MLALPRLCGHAMSVPTTAPPVGRLAPSPTGRLHLGHARSFLLAWWSVRSRGGRIVLRIEDLDRARVRPGAVDEVLRDLEWLGLDWDAGPYLQAGDLGPAQAALDRLLAGGRAYPCVCSRKSIESVQSAPHAEDGTLRYPGTCRDRFAGVAEAERVADAAVGLRLRVPPGVVRWTDALRGAIETDVGAEVGDFLLARRDGVLGYQLAVVVDDARQGVTEVLRGDDLIASTARQILVADALGLAHPTWIHVPLVVDEQGRRLAKRDGDLALASLRAAGVDPRTVVGWAARSAGQLADPRPSPAEVARSFALARLPREPVVLDRATLASLRRSSGP